MTGDTATLVIQQSGTTISGSITYTYNGTSYSESIMGSVVPGTNYPANIYFAAPEFTGGSCYAGCEHWLLAGLSQDGHTFGGASEGARGSTDPVDVRQWTLHR